MGFMYSIQICEISHQTFGPSHRKCPTCPMIFVNTADGTKPLPESVLTFHQHQNYDCGLFLAHGISTGTTSLSLGSFCVCSQPMRDDVTVVSHWLGTFTNDPCALYIFSAALIDFSRTNRSSKPRQHIFSKVWQQLANISFWNTLKCGKNGLHIANDILKCGFLKKINFRVKWQYIRIGSVNGLAPKRWHTITWTSGNQNEKKNMASVGHNELTHPSVDQVSGHIG